MVQWHYYDTLWVFFFFPLHYTPSGCLSPYTVENCKLRNGCSDAYRWIDIDTRYWYISQRPLRLYDLFDMYILTRARWNMFTVNKLSRKSRIWAVLQIILYTRMYTVILRICYIDVTMRNVCILVSQYQTAIPNEKSTIHMCQYLHSTHRTRHWPLYIEKYMTHVIHHHTQQENLL